MHPSQVFSDVLLQTCSSRTISSRVWGIVCCTPAQIAAHGPHVARDTLLCYPWRILKREIVYLLCPSETRDVTP